MEGGKNEDDLEKELRSCLQSVSRREPLDPTYQRLLLNGSVTHRRPTIPKDKFYKSVWSRLRERVEVYQQETAGKDPFDRISQRKPLEEDKMRAALTLRESKEHEQQALLDATLVGLPKRNGVDEFERRKHLEAIAVGLQARALKKKSISTRGSSFSSRSKALANKQKKQQHGMETERQQRTSQERALRESMRRKREEEIEGERDRDRKRERERKQQQRAAAKSSEGERTNASSSNSGGNKRKNQSETQPQQALYKLYYPIFMKLWDMEFIKLGGTNPFRIVIDRENCASMGAPDYFDIIEIPMNLTYIQKKVNNMEYESLQSFREDFELMIQNAITYNSDASNPYRIAAEEMKRKGLKIFKKIFSYYSSKTK